MPTLDWDTYCDELVPQLLTRWGAGHFAETVTAELHERAQGFADSGVRARDVLRAPFVEEVVGHQPEAAPVSILAAVCLIVRCTHLEEAHVEGHLHDDGIRSLTTTATRPLLEWLNERYCIEISAPPAGPFAGLDTTWPRAWAALEALTSVPDGGRESWRALNASEPELPGDNEIVEAERNTAGHVIASALDPRFDSDAAELLTTVEPGMVIAILNISRLSRNTDKVMRMVEIILARGGSVLTSNLLIRPGEVHCRRGDLVKPTTRDIADVLLETAGLTGLHRKIATQVRREVLAGHDND
jgi:hypothetical protein